MTKTTPDYRLTWVGEISRRRSIRPLARCILTWLVLRAQWSGEKGDGLIIVGKGEIAERFGIKSSRTVDVCISELVTSGCLQIVQLGSALKGQNRRASIYALGPAFDGIPPKARLGQENNRVRAAPGYFECSDQGNKIPPLSLALADNTHREDAPLACGNGFSEKTWEDYCRKEWPEWEVVDVKGSYLSAIDWMKKRDGQADWQTYAKKCRLRWRPTSKKMNGNGLKDALCKAGKPSSNKSVPAGFIDVYEWEDAGQPKDFKTWLKWGCPLRRGIPSGTITDNLKIEILKAAKKGVSLTPDKAKEMGHVFENSDWEIAQARARLIISKTKKDDIVVDDCPY